VLLGGRTYEQVMTFGVWPYPGKPTWVFSSRALEVAGPDTIVTGASPSQVVPELEGRGIRRAWLARSRGSGWSIRRRIPTGWSSPATCRSTHKGSGRRLNAKKEAR